jgi:uncharacterized membrane protein (UPF0127 family)
MAVERNKIQKYLVIIFLCLAITILLIYYFSPTKEYRSVWPNYDGVLKVADKKIKIAIADTPAKRARGFMYVKAIPEDSGMLFVFDNEDKHCFWMKNTSIPLSIAFINAQMEIVQIENMYPYDTTNVCPSTKILYALEVPQNYFKENNIKVKDKIHYYK